MKYMKFALLIALCIPVVACTATKQNSAATDTASMEWRIKSLEESFLNFREKQRLEADENVQNREITDQRVQTLEKEVAALKDGTAVAAAPDDEPVDEGWVTDLKPEDEGWVDGQKGAAPPAAVAQSDEEKPWSDVPGSSAPATIPEPKVIKRSGAQPVKKASASRPTVSGAQAMYDAGLTKYQADDFEGARGAFDEFLKKYPSSDLAPNALYWKGETYYSQKDFAQAILTFKEVTGRYPKHHKSASALLKIGMSYDKVGDPDNAIFYLRALVEDFPKADASKLARKELNRLGG